MRVLLVSTYELGHQPLHVASPAALLRRVGHEVRCLDLSVEGRCRGAGVGAARKTSPEGDGQVSVASQYLRRLSLAL